MSRKRRQNGEGTCTRRKDGRWMAQATIGYDTFTGRQQRLTAYGDTAREAREALAAKQAERAQQAQEASAALTVRRAAEWWLVGAKPGAAAVTYMRYVRDAARVVRYLGDRVVDELAPAEISRAYEKMKADGVGPAAMHLAGRTLRQLLESALRGTGRVNPAAQVPVPRAGTPEMVPLTADQARAFLTAAEGTWLGPLYATALDSGARSGELFALTPADVDWDAGALSISKTTSDATGGRVVKSPKTRASRRTVLLSPHTLGILQAHRAALQAEGRWARLLFPGAGGGTLQRVTVGNHLGRLLGRAGLPHIRFHDLRHTCATLLLAAGCPVKVVSERLGHSAVTITLATYAHTLPGQQAAAAAQMGRIMWGDPGGTAQQ